jgi:dolichol-phosphate mannosyltransferase
LRLAVVIPLTNEEKTTNDFLRQFLKHLWPEDRVFCFFDNACKDRTLLITNNFSEKESRVEIVWAPENRCVVDAYFKGYQAAYEAGARWILEMDGGLSHQPDEIPRFFKIS